MKNYLILNQKHVLITVLNIPGEFPLLTVIYKGFPTVTIYKTLVVRDVIFDSLKTSDETTGECVVSFLNNNLNQSSNKFVPSLMISNKDIVNKLLGYLSILLRHNKKFNPDENIDLDKYELKHKSLIKSMCKEYFEINTYYEITSNKLNGVYKLTEIGNGFLMLISNESSTNILKINFIDIIYHEMKFNKIN